MVTTERTYEAEIEAWHQSMEDKLRAETGWLTLTGLYWLHEGENSLGSDLASDVILPGNTPAQLGFIDFHDGVATLRVTTNDEVIVDGMIARSGRLRDDTDAQGYSLVEIGSANFFVIERSGEYAIRMRDRNNPARKNFGGRVWFPTNPAYRVTAEFKPYSALKTLEIINILGMAEPTLSPGVVDFALDGHDVRLEAFDAKDNQIWFVFRDTSKQTYPAARFLYATVEPDNRVILDFNKSYNPPCAFTDYATCPLPPKQNILTFPIEVGEKTTHSHD